MSRVTATRFSDYLTRTFGLKGREEPQGVIPDVMPVCSLVDPTDVEHHWTRGEVLWGMPCQVNAGGAGTYSRLEVVGRAGVITVVEAAMISSSATAQVVLNLAIAGLSGASNTAAVRTDSRSQLTAAVPGVSGYQATPGAPPGANIGTFIQSANAPTIVPLGVVLDGTTRLIISQNNANLTMYVQLWGYDRLTGDWERA